MNRTAVVDATLIATVLIWAVNFSVVKLVIEHLDPLAFNTFRLVGATALLLVLAHFSGGPGIARRDWARFLFLGLLGHTGYQLLFIHSIHLTTASNAALLLGLTPAFVAALSTLVGVERASLVAWIGIFISVLGVYLVLGASGNLGGSARGDWLALAATVVWASYTVLGRELATRYGAFKSNAYLMSIGTLFFLPFGVPAVWSMSFVDVPVEAWYGTLFSLAFALVFAYCAWYYAVSKIGPTSTAAYSNLMPVAAVGVAHLWLGEPVSARQLVGAGAILLGIYLVRLRSAA